MLVSNFKSVAQVKNPQQIEVATWLEEIRTGKYQQQIINLRENYGKSNYGNLKTKLPGVTLSALCSHRQQVIGQQEDNRLISYSHIIQVDIDSTDDVETIKKIFSSDPHCLFAFVSPSGVGVKAGFLVDKDEKTHSFNFAAIEKYILENYDIQIDPSVKDLYRLCFVSYDPKLYYNPAAIPLEVDIETLQEELQAKENKQIITEIDKKTKVASNVNISKAIYFDKHTANRRNKIKENKLKWAKNALNVPKGARHNARLRVGFLLGGYIAGEPDLFVESEVLAEILPHVTSNSTIPKRATSYFIDAMQKGKGKPLYIQTKQKNNSIEALSKEAKTTEKNAKEGKKEQVKIKVELKKIDKEKHRVNFTDKTTGEITECDWLDFVKSKRTGKPECQVNQAYFGRWLSEQGFYFIAAPPSSKGVVEYDLIKVENYIVSSVSIDGILSMVKEYFQPAFDKPEIAPFATSFLRQIEQATRRPMLLLSVDLFNGVFIRDTKTSAFFCYKNGIVEVSKNVQKLHKYGDVGLYVWRENFINRNFDENAGSEARGGDFEVFVQNLATRRDKKTGKESFASDRHKALVCSIGHYLHTYKSPISKAVVFSESSLSDATDAADGRSGKSLLMKAVGKIRNVATIDLGSTSKNDAFHFENVEAGKTDIIFCDEMPRNCKINDYFSNITDQLVINRKFQSKVVLTGKDVPKFAFATNYAITQTTGSAKGRLFDMELEQYYTADYRPIDDFGKLFFDDWDEKEWAEFDMFMMSCVRTYFEEDKNLPSYFSNTAAQKKMLTKSNVDFMEFMEEEMPKTGSIEIARKTFYEMYCSRYNINEKSLTANRFGGWITTYCELFGIIFERAMRRYDPANRQQTATYIFTAPEPAEENN